MFNNLKSSIQQAFFESLEQAGCLQLETEGREEDSDSGSEASDEEGDEEGSQEDGEGGEEDGEDEAGSDSEELPGEAPGPHSQRLLPPDGGSKELPGEAPGPDSQRLLPPGGGSKVAPGESGEKGFVEVNLDSITSSAATADSRDPTRDAALHRGSGDSKPLSGV